MLTSNCLVCSAATTTATICCDRLLCPDCYQKLTKCPGCHDKRIFNTRVDSKSYFKNDGTYQCACSASGPQSQWERHFSTHAYRKPVPIKSRAPPVKSGQKNGLMPIILSNPFGYSSGQYAIAIGYAAGTSRQCQNAIGLKGAGGRL